MYRRLVLVFCLLFIYFQASECGVGGRSGSSGRSGGGKRSSSMMEGGTYDNYYASPSAQKGANPSRNLQSGGLSAWGLILIMTVVIIVGFGAYYGVICYPFFCKHEGSYQFMDASSTVTTTSRSIQSIENFQHDQKPVV